jgi:hypothetical protein
VTLELGVEPQAKKYPCCRIQWPAIPNNYQDFHHSLPRGERITLHISSVPGLAFMSVSFTVGVVEGFLLAREEQIRCPRL